MRGLAPLCGLGSLLVLLALAAPVQAFPSIQSSVCDYYVDNHAGSDGDGSWTRPWNDINDHLEDLVPGDAMCVRGGVSGSGRVYEVNEIYVNSDSGRVRDGAPGNPITVRSYPGETVILRNVGDDDNDSIVYFRGADYWVFEGFVMDNNGRDSKAVRLKHDANHNVLRDNEIYNGKTSGVGIYQGQNVGNVIENNHIHHFDAGDKDAHCIVLHRRSDDTVIRGNVLHDCSGDGVQIYVSSETPISEYAKNVQIVRNTFYRGTLRRAENAIDVKGSDGLEVTDNELYGYDWSAIVVHKGSRNLLFDSNVIHDSRGIDCHSSEEDRHLENITIRNNLLYNLDHHAISLEDVYGAVVLHNTIANSSDHSFSIWGEGIHGGEIRNNLIYNSGEADITSVAPFDDVTVGYNGWFDAESEFTAATDIVGSGDPGFLDLANHDYHLTAASLVRDAGIDVGVTTDFEGDPRPFGSRPDIGADEFTPILYLRASPRDRVIYLRWTEFEDPELASYVITYTYGTGGRDASQGPSPISNLPMATRTYSLTDVANYAFYTVTVAACDGSDADLAVSNSVSVMPTDIFVYLPAVMKKAP